MQDDVAFCGSCGTRQETGQWTQTAMAEQPMQQYPQQQGYQQPMQQPQCQQPQGYHQQMQPQYPQQGQYQNFPNILENTPFNP